MRDVASKTADNAARIAAWHLHEARRFYGELALPEEQANAARLERWLADYCRREKTAIVQRRVVQQFAAPRILRKGPVLDAALDELAAEGHVRLIQDGQRKEIHVHPALRKVSSPTVRLVKTAAQTLAVDTVATATVATVATPTG